MNSNTQSVSRLFTQIRHLGPHCGFNLSSRDRVSRIDLKQPVSGFLFLFLVSNCVDDFLIRYDGIVFSGFCLLYLGAIA
jgi:hypothetical protein